MPKIQMRRDTAANWSSVNPVLASGEWAVETDTTKSKVGDGVTHYNDLDYIREEDNEWVKPSEWIDIRSGALPNSVYFLVGHKADYSKYPTFTVNATVSNSGTYDVYIDGIKRFTTASDSDTAINWSTLALESGWDVTYPSSLKTHIVRVIPSVSTNTITAIKDSTNSSVVGAHGLLWVHFTLTNAINLASAFSKSGILLAVTCVTDELTVTSLNATFTDAMVQTLPTFTGTNIAISSFQQPLADAARRASLRKLKFKNFTSSGSSWFAVNYFNQTGFSPMKEIEGENATFKVHDCIFGGMANLKNISVMLDFSTSKTSTKIFQRCTGLNDFIVDASAGTVLQNLSIGGEETYPINSLKGIIVSNEAPFNNTTSPQLDVSYTGLDRHALRRLFKSLPYNVAYEKVGSPTITDGILTNTYWAWNGGANNNYIQTSTPWPENVSSYEIVLKVKGKAEATAGWRATFSNSVTSGAQNVHMLDIYSASNLQNITLRYSPNYSANTDILFSKQIVPVNSWIWIKITHSEDNYSLYTSTDGTNYTLVQSVTSELEPVAGRSIFYGASSTAAGTMNYEIDLNETYIKVNGIPFFGPGVTKNLVPGGTLVGSPTVTDGVMSSFSVSKYLTLPSASALNVDTMEWNFVFKTGTVVTPAAIKYLFGYEDWGGLTIRSSGAFGFTWLKKSTYAWEENGSGTIHAEANTTYRCNIVFDNTAGTAVVSVKKADGTSVFSETYSNTNARIYGTPVVGIRGNPSTHADNYFNGSVDLNNSYINVNGSRFWTGMVPQTKTCSIVGCTGTASLTQADKNIALNKGWELTLS